MPCDRRAYLIALIALTVGCGGGSKKVKGPTVSTSKERKVRNVEIRGNKHISSSSLIDGLAHRPPIGRFFKTPQPFDPVELERDQRRIEVYYKQRGYFTVKVQSVEVKRIGKKQVDIIITLREGPLTTIRSVAVRGAPNRPGLTTTDLLEVAKLRIGDGMVYKRYKKAKSRIRALLARAGYAFARVHGKIRVDRRISAAHIDLRVDPGPLAVFGKTTVVGLKRIPERSVRARMAYERGEPFSSKKLAESRRRLYALGVFSTVRFEYAKQKRPEVADITIRLKEGRRHQIKLGGGFGIDSTRYEVRGRAAYSERGFLMPLLTLRIEARPSYSFLRDSEDFGALHQFGFDASVGLTKEDFIRPLWRGSAKVTYTVREFTAYSIAGPRLVLAVTRRLFGDRVRIGAAWKFRLQQFLSTTFKDVDEAQVLGFLPTWELFGFPLYRLGVFQQSIAYDGRDNPITPRRGLYAEFRIEESGSYALSKFSYIRVVPEVRGYLSLGKRIVLAARGRFGRVVHGNVLPITERFFAGGASSQRGFGLQRLSPRLFGDPDGDPIGGQAMVETSLEARLDLFKLFGNWLGIVTFLDGGDATREPEDLSLTNLHWAAGVGLRYRTVIGPVRFDTARRLNRYGTGELTADGWPYSKWQVHISLGEAF